jgi:hypothetical protein
VSQSYTSQRHFSSEIEVELFVSSSRCRYRVWIQSDEVTLLGPGVNEQADRDNLPQFDTFEDLGVYLVLMFESGLWPEE